MGAEGASNGIRVGLCFRSSSRGGLGQLTPCVRHLKALVADIPHHPMVLQFVDGLFAFLPRTPFRRTLFKSPSANLDRRATRKSIDDHYSPLCLGGTQNFQRKRAQIVGGMWRDDWTDMD